MRNGRFSASPETQSKSFRGGERSYFRLISVRPMKQRWFRGLTISNQRTEMTRSYNISRRRASSTSRRLHATLGVRPTFLAVSDGYEIPGKCQPHGELFPLLCMPGGPTTSAPYAHTVYSHVNYEELLVSWAYFVLGLRDTMLPRGKEFPTNISLGCVTKISIILLRDLSLTSLGNCTASAQKRNTLSWQLSGCGFCH